MLRTKRTLYNDLLNGRIAAFCQPLDRDLEIKFLGVIRIPGIEGEMSYETHRRLLAELASHPRGHWAIYHNADGIDAWMSTGVGGPTPQSGHTCNNTPPKPPYPTPQQ